MLHESALWMLRDQPLNVLRMPGWLMTGKATLKQELARLLDFNPAALPHNSDLLAWLEEQRANGRHLILCTASDRTIAEAIAQHLDLFDDVMASDGAVNLAGPNKALALEQRFGEGGFDYVGNSHADLAVWARVRRAIVVNASGSLLRKAGEHCEVEQVFPRAKLGMRAMAKVLRVHQ